MQLVASPAADLGVASSILAHSHTFVEIDRGHSPSPDSRRDAVSYKQMYVHNILVNRLVNVAPEKVW